MKDLKNQRFSKLVVLDRLASNRQGSATWKCLCDCGKICVYSNDHLTRKKQSVKSCGCGKKRSGKDHHQWTGIGDISGHWWNSRIGREIAGNKKRAKLPVTITIQYVWDLFLKQNRQCALSGFDLIISNKNSDNTASLDRIDSSLGYIGGNVQWVHKHINRMKNTYDNEYFIAVCQAINQNQSNEFPKKPQ